MQAQAVDDRGWMPWRFLVALTLMVGLATACGGGDDETASEPASTDEEVVDAGDGSDPSSDDDNNDDNNGDDPVDSTVEGDDDAASTTTVPDDFDPDDPVALEATGTVRLMTHDSFAVPDNLFDSFTLETGVEVEVIKAGDAGELVSRALLTAGQPEADVLFGIDNALLQRALDNNLFLAYEAEGLDTVPAELVVDAENRVTPIDYGDVCVNYWRDALDGPAPTSIAELAEPEFASSFVTQDPQTSSPGLAFLLATIATFGEDGWEDYWQQLADGGVGVTPGWTDAYYGEFVAGGGDRALVTSYASSPVAEFIFATSDIDEPPTGVITDGCFRQIEFAGILAGSEAPEAAAKLIDFMLSPTFQAEIPLNMFVSPANAEVELPDTYAQWAAEVAEPVIMDPAEIEANLNAWTERWTEIVLR